MMNGSHDDDDFGPNPFRIDSNDTDLLGTPNAPAPAAPSMMQQQQPYNNNGQQLQQQPMMYGQQQPQPNYGQQQQAQALPQQSSSSSFDAMQPDPVTGMTGTLNIPSSSSQPSMQQQQQPQDSTRYLSGTMDQGNAPTSPTAEPPAASIFSIRGITQTCCNFEQFATLFDMDSMDIYWRLKAAATQFWLPDQFRTAVIGDSDADTTNDSQQQQQQARNNKGPDLYGPFWISMTLVWVLGMTANLSAYLHHQRKQDEDVDKEFEYDINHLLSALSVVSIFAFAVPTVFWLTCSCMGMPGIPWALWMCCYGYSMVPVLLGALVAWWLPYEIWHWVILALAVAASGLLVVRNLSSPLLSQDSANHAKAAPVVLAILCVHAIFLFTLKIKFYP